MVEQNL